MENPPFYKFNLLEVESLTSELERLYEVSHNLSHYTRIVFRGFDDELTKNGYKIYDSYEEAKAKLDDLLEIQRNDDTKIISQINLCGNHIDWHDYPNIWKWIKNKTLELYGDSIKIKKWEDGSNRYTIHKVRIGECITTIYQKDCILTNHKDGVGPNSEDIDFFKPANLLLYLNKDYKKEYGGCFIVEDTIEIVPEFGTLIFLNFDKGNNPSHQINKVTADVNRAALLFNVTYSKKDREIWKIE
jgi:Rps23 Pro-64 3,4-dihydroxylase Tpa1-like proline 4-hydroxylase